MNNFNRASAWVKNQPDLDINQLIGQDLQNIANYLEVLYTCLNNEYGTLQADRHHRLRAARNELETLSDAFKVGVLKYREYEHFQDNKEQRMFLLKTICDRDFSGNCLAARLDLIKNVADQKILYYYDKKLVDKDFELPTLEFCV